MTARVEAEASTARERLLRGLEVSIRARGYQATKISDIVAHARTSKRTFYEVFASKDACLLALLDELTAHMQEQIVAAVDATAAWQEQIRAGVTAWLDTVAAEPELSVSWIRELPSLGAVAYDAQRNASDVLTRMLMAMTDTPRMRRAGVRPASRAAALILLGGLRELAAAVLEEGGDIRSITEPAVDAAVALLGPR